MGNDARNTVCVISYTDITAESRDKKSILTITTLFLSLSLSLIPRCFTIFHTQYNNHRPSSDNEISFGCFVFHNIDHSIEDKFYTSTRL